MSKNPKPPFDHNEFFTELFKSGPRVAAIVACAMAENSLGELLERRMKPARKGGYIPLGQRIELSYRLGLIDENFAEALEDLASLRNDCAHWTCLGGKESFDFSLVKKVDKFLAHFGWVPTRNISGEEAKRQARFITATLCMRKAFVMLFRRRVVRNRLPPASLPHENDRGFQAIFELFTNPKFGIV